MIVIKWKAKKEQLISDFAPDDESASIEPNIAHLSKSTTLYFRERFCTKCKYVYYTNLNIFKCKFI